MSSQKLTSEERFFFAKEFLQSGCSAGEWSESMGINRATLYKWLKEFDLPLPSGRLRDDPIKNDEAARVSLGLKQEVVKVELPTASILCKSPTEHKSCPKITTHPDNFDIYNDCDCEISLGDLKISFTRNLPPQLLSIVCDYFGRQS